MRRRAGLFLLVVMPPFVAAHAVVPEVPTTASPGEIGRVTAVGEPCPTFSWSAAARANGYELTVHRLGATEEVPDPVLRKHFAGPVHSWTPALDECLERGARYAWAVRALTADGPSDWSLPGLFEVVRGPGRAELEAALEVVRSYLRANHEAGLPRETERPDDGAAGGLAEAEPDRRRCSIESRPRE